MKYSASSFSGAAAAAADADAFPFTAAADADAFPFTAAADAHYDFDLFVPPRHDDFDYDALFSGDPNGAEAFMDDYDDGAGEGDEYFQGGGVKRFTKRIAFFKMVIQESPAWNPSRISFILFKILIYFLMIHLFCNSKISVLVT
jgi:hypothetical protein